MPETIVVPNETGMLAIGGRLSRRIQPGSVVFLYGDLGCGKTTLARGILHGLGYPGVVNSPTYTLVEIYPELTPTLYHFDLYRLESAAELEMIGARDIFDRHNACLIEWPQRASEALPQPSLSVHIEIVPHARILTINDAANGDPC